MPWTSVVRANTRMAEIHGSCDDLFTAPANALAGLLDGGDVGGSGAVFVDRAPVVDVWGGFADADRTIPWQRDTITGVFSVTKTMTALCALVLADRGDLDLDAPVGRYWPEFAAAGKEKVLVRHLLAHTAGLPDWDGPIEELYDWPAATARLAGLAPLWEPGSTAGYHSLTQGFLVGEVVRRITGRSLGEFFAAEVAAPLGADFHIGLSAEHDQRVARTVPPSFRDEDYATSAPGGSGPPPPAPPSGCGTGTAWPGVVRRSPRRAVSATRARSRSCSRCWPAEAPAVGCGCCRRRAATGHGKSSSAGRTGAWACRSVGGWATDCSAAAWGGAVGAAR